MSRRLALLLVPLAAAAGLIPSAPVSGLAQDNDDPRPEDLITIRKGTLPIILSAPHGGRKPIPGVPERKGGPRVEKFQTVRDDNTAELTVLLTVELEKKLGG